MYSFTKTPPIGSFPDGVCVPVSPETVMSLPGSWSNVGLKDIWSVLRALLVPVLSVMRATLMRGTCVCVLCVVSCVQWASYNEMYE